MTIPTISGPLKWVGIAALACACAWITFSAKSCVGQHRVDAQVQQADQHHEAAVAASSQGADHDQEADQHQAQLQGDAAEVARLRAKLARVRKAPPAAPAPPSTPGAPEPEPVAPPVDLAAVVAQQDLLITAQDKQIQDQAGQIHTLTLARDSWRLSAQESAQEALQLRSALLAQQGVAKAQRWMGRLEGLAVGLGAGYVGGRLH